MWGRKMKILPRMLLLFVSIVVFFGAVITVNAYLDSQREQKNINTLYVERGLSIAKSLDASVTGEAELQANAQPLVDELMASNLGVTEFSIHGKAPAGQSASGYWRLQVTTSQSFMRLPTRRILRQLKQINPLLFPILKMENQSLMLPILCMIRMGSPSQPQE